MSTRRLIAAVFRWTAYLGVGLIGAAVLTIGLVLWQRPWLPYIFDFGPYTGRPAAAIPTSTPADTYVFGRFTLTTHDPSQADEAPVVVLRDDRGSVLWAIRAEGHERTSVSEVRFMDHRTLWHTTVRGNVKWTYGHEGCWWIIDRSGRLVSYYYSW